MNRLTIARSILGLSCVFVCAAAGLDTRDRTISQFLHTTWTAKDGVPPGIFDIAQTNDGYIWLGAATGLYRFDGVQFERYVLPHEEKQPLPYAYPLRATSDGGLWIGQGVGACFLKNDHPMCYGPAEGLNTGFTSITQDLDGTIWASNGFQGPMRLVGSHWEVVGQDWGYPVTAARTVFVFADRQGTLWAVIGDSIMYLPRGEKTFKNTGERINGRVLDMAEASDGTIWISVDVVTRRIPVRVGKGPLPPLEIGSEGTGILFDHAGSLWIGSINGLLRVRYPERLSGTIRVSDSKEIEKLNKTDGLTSSVTWTVFEDREANIWVSTDSGLDRFRATDLVPVKIPSGFNSLLLVPGEQGADLTAAFFSHDSHEWIGIGMPGGAMSRHRFGGVNFMAAYRNRSGVVWLATTGPNRCLWRFDHGPPVRVPLPVGISGVAEVRSITEDYGGNLWVAISGYGVFRRSNGVWTKPFQGFLSAWGLIADSLGRVWVTARGTDQVGVFDGRTVQTFSSRDGIPRSPSAIYGRSGHVWVGGGGLAVFDGSHFHTLVADGLTFTGITGIVETEVGDLWLNALAGFIHVSAAEVRQGIEKSDYHVRCEVLSYFDGLQTTTLTFKLPTTALETSNGRLWLVNGQDFLFYLDPARQSKNPMPPPVFIRSLDAGGKVHRPSQKIDLPGGTRNLRISYTALSYALPQRVQFRYQLEGVEKGWQDAGTRREAFYTNLGPGSYRFRVIACNSDGVWNEAGATLGFSIAPAFYQAWWFLSLCGALVFATAVAAYHLRIRQLTAAINGRFDERLAERTRIARDFHDTLLQTVQGSKLVADDALDEAADPAHMRKALERLSGWLGQAIEEGRSALNSLRGSTTETNDLAAALRRAGQECIVQRSLEFQLSVEGDSQDMHPIVRDEVYRIGYEAMRNSCMHSGASRLHVELSYVENLILRVRDNGKGIDPKVAEDGKQGHFGLIGMYERASRIRGKLSLSSSPSSGTDVELVVPREIAFQHARPMRPFALFRRLF